MLKQLSKQDMQQVVGGLGVVDFYIDEHGKIIKISRPVGPGFFDKPVRTKSFPFPRLSTTNKG